MSICSRVFCAEGPGDFFSDLEEDGHSESSNFPVDYLPALAVVLQRRPDVVISVLATFVENTKARLQDQILVITWLISQVRLRDHVVGLFVWVRYLLPLLKTSESILYKKYRNMIIDTIERLDKDIGVTKGERCTRPSTLELYLRTTSISLKDGRRSSSYAMYTAHFCSPESEDAKRISEQLIPFALKAAGKGVYCLAREAWQMFFWCLTHSIDSFRQWDNLYLGNLPGTIFIMEKLSGWPELLQENLYIIAPLMSTMKSFVSKSGKALATEHVAAARQAALKNAQKHAGMILGPLAVLDWQIVEVTRPAKTPAERSVIWGARTNKAASNLFVFNVLY